MTLTPAPRTTVPMVVLAEDNTQIQSLVAQVLRMDGYHVLVTSDGDEAAAALRKLRDRVDLLVLDLDLPGRHGLTVLHEIRQHRPTLPVLIATGSVDFTIAELDDPHAALLRKPYTMLELRSIARQLLGTPDRRRST
jgi:DNA-binding response OmpR family regulator